MTTCTANRFDYSGYVYLGEALLGDPDGSAVATWGATHLSLNDPGGVLAEEFLHARYYEGDRRIGDGIKTALGRYFELGQIRFVADMHVLLGDPATLMK
jgi:hypothetical protein